MADLARGTTGRLDLAYSQLRTTLRSASLVLFLCPLLTHICAAQSHDVVCRDGDGSFQAESSSGVALVVRAARAGELATRSCQANLRWTDGNLVVASNVPEIDVDTFGTDLGLGSAVTTLQVRQSAGNCCMEYLVYSLEKTPRLLRTINGGDFFSAADVDLDGRVEIWTHDAAAMKDFEDLSVADFDSAPTIVLRFERGQLFDVSAEF